MSWFVWLLRAALPEIFFAEASDAPFNNKTYLIRSLTSQLIVPT
jgi:hypothetical protein